MHSRDEWATPADFSLRGRRRRGRAAGAAWTAAALWIALAGWCIYLVVTVDRLREDVRSRVSWVLRAEEVRHQTVQFAARTARTHASPRGGLLFLFPPGLRDALGPHGLLADLPDRVADADRARWIAGELVVAAERLDGLPLSGRSGRGQGGDVGAVMTAAHQLDETLSELIETVRQISAERSDRLARKWDALYVLAALCVAALGALAILIWRWRRDAVAMSIRERRFRTLVQSAQDLIWAVDAQGRWTFVNDAARRIYGYEPRAMLGRNFAEFTTPECAEKDIAAFREIMDGATKYQHETVHLGEDGRRVTLLFNATPMRDARGRVLGSMGSATDITHTRAMQARLLLNERLQAVATLGGGVAHDFNNLLTVIIGQTEVAKSRADLTPFLRRRIDSILDTAERARKLTQQLIAFARRTPLSREVVDLSAVVRELEELTCRIAGDAVRVRHSVPDRPVKVVADWGQLEQVIINLVGNARDALPQGGTVTVTVWQRDLRGEEAAEAGITAGAWAGIEVSDNGTGIEEEILPHIFDPFFTTKEPGKGTGLGLATVHGVISQHGGTITVHSRPREGTRMVILLPVADEETFKKDDETASNPEPGVPHAAARPVGPPAVPAAPVR